MQIESNKFGSGNVYDASGLGKSIYAVCTACMSVYSEFLSWANANPERFAENPDSADDIIILSCQVTDLAVLNDLRTAEDLMRRYPGKTFYVGGCLARRFDIELPEGCRRLGNVYSDGTEIKSKVFIDYKKPFWVKRFNPDAGEFSDGNLFRDRYPLRIGVGCRGKCKYCTIRVTRGELREIRPSIEEFLENGRTVLIADSPSVEQIGKWTALAIGYNKHISIRNIEPTVAAELMPNLVKLARKNLLEIFHCPIQHTDKKALKSMNRDYQAMYKVKVLAGMLKEYGVVCATNIIIDYKGYANPDVDLLNQLFDYISWNPYWDGKWDRTEAEKRWDKYLG